MLAVMVTLLTLLVLWQLRIVVIYVLISLILAATLRPLVNRLGSMSWAARIGWISVFFFTLGSLGLLIFFAGKSAVSEIQILGKSLTEQDAWTLPFWLEGSTFQKYLIERLPPPSNFVEAIFSNEGQLVLPVMLGFVKGLGGLVTAVLVIIFLSIYWSTNQIHFERLWLSLLSSDHRKRTRGIWRVIESDMGNYIRGQFLQSLLTGLLFALGYWILGSPYPALLALIGAILILIPVIGSVLVLIPPLLLGLLTTAQHSFLTLLYTIIILIFMWVWIKPRFFNRKWDNPILTVIILIAMADAFGIIGIIAAPPVSAICQILWSRLVSNRVSAGAATNISDLKERLANLIETVSAMDEPHLPLVTSTIERISSLIAEAEQILETERPSDPNLNI